MWREVLNIIPRLSPSDLNNLERSLNRRFGRIARGFGRGLKISAAVSLGAAVLDKLINPLNEVRAAIDKTLGNADDVVTNARQFNTSTENLLKLRALGAARGIPADQMDQLLLKFQTAVAQARLNPNDPANAAVRNFIGEKDTAVGFFNFFKGLQQLNPTEQTLVQEKVFGEKLILKMAELLQDKGFAQSAEALKNVDFAKTAKSVEKLAGLADKNQENKTVRDLNDFVAKARVIGGQTIRNLNGSEINNLTRENNRIARSAQAFTAEERMAEIGDNVEKLTTELITNLPIVMDGLNATVNLLRKSVEGWQLIFGLLKGSPLLKGVKGLFGGGKDD